MQKRKAEVLGAHQFPRMKSMRITTAASPAINSLPEDLLVEILARVAASSFTDLFNTKLASKDFLKGANDGQIFRRISLQNIPRVSWKTSPESSSFMEICKNNGNPEALYRRGMLEFFSHRKEASGLANLKASAMKGHAEASYVYGVVLYRSSTRGLKQEGVEFLKSCEAKGSRMAECRRRIKGFVADMWINRIPSPEDQEDSGGRRSCDCIGNSGKNQRRKGWEWTDEEDDNGEDTCEACKWEREVSRFCNMLRTGRYN